MLCEVVELSTRRTKADASQIDFSSSSDSMNQSGQAAMQADMVEQNIKMIEKEWGDEWE